MLHAKRNVALLAGCQAVFVTGSSLVVACTALVGAALAPDPRLATLPVGCLFVVATVTTLPASLLMKRVGRRAGFVLGVLVGAAGATVCSIAIVQSSFPLFCTGASLLGVLAAFAPYYRFAAVEAVESQWRPRAIAAVVGGGLVAAFLGPNLARWTREALPGGLFAGSYACLALLQVVALLLLCFLRLPPQPEEERTGEGRSLWAIARQPGFGLAVLAAVVSYAVMNALMTATPLAMSGHGFRFDHTASVIQWHIVGMYAPALFTGRLIERVGTLRTMTLGALTIAASSVTGLSGATLWHFWISLAGLGLGWNFLFVGATDLLTRTYSPAEKAKTQGLNDLLVFGTLSMSGTASGALHAAIGWKAMNLAVLPIVLSVAALSWLARRAYARSARRGEAPNAAAPMT